MLMGEIHGYGKVFIVFLPYFSKTCKVVERILFFSSYEMRYRLVAMKNNQVISNSFYIKAII
jgi:hypothetical protein